MLPLNITAKLEGNLGAIEVLTNKAIRLGVAKPDPERSHDVESTLIDTLTQVEVACDNLALVAHGAYAELLRRRAVRMRRDDTAKTIENPVR